MSQQGPPVENKPPNKRPVRPDSQSKARRIVPIFLNDVKGSFEKRGIQADKSTRDSPTSLRNILVQ